MENSLTNVDSITPIKSDSVYIDLNNNGEKYESKLNEGIETINSIDKINQKTKNVRLIYCGDGVVEECDEDDEERERQEREEKERIIEERRQLDIEAKKMPWMPWMGYMVKKSAVKTLETCDYMGEKLAWWFGITQPKFLYEIQEYERMKKEEEEANKDDLADEIIVGVNYPDNRNYENNNNYSDFNNKDAERKLFNQNEKKMKSKLNTYRQQQFGHSNSQEPFDENNL